MFNLVNRNRIKKQLYINYIIITTNKQFCGSIQIVYINFISNDSFLAIMANEYFITILCCDQEKITNKMTT